MKQSFRTTLVFAGVLVALLAFYLIYDKNLQPKHEKAEEKAKQLLSLDEKDVQWLEIDRLKDRPKDDAATPPPAANAEGLYEKIQLKRTGDEWSLVSPVQDRADAGVVKGMVSTLTTTKQERVVDEKPKDLAVYGLKTPLLKILARKDDKSPAEEIDLGKNTPVGYSTYAKTGSSETVYKITRSLLTQFDKPVKDLRNKDIVQIPRFDVVEVDITAPKLSLILTRDAKDNWTLARENIPADNNEWNKTLNALVDLKATDFVSETGSDAAQFGLVPPLAKVELAKKDKSRVTLLFGKAKDKVYVKRADKPVIYAVDKAILDKIEQPAAKYRNTQLASFNRFDVSRIKLERGDGSSIVLAKEKNDWTLPADPKAKVDGTKVDTFLTKLQDTKITTYSKTPAKLEAPKLVIRLFEKKDNAEKETVVLKFAPPRGGQVLTARSDIPLTFEIKADDFAKLDLGNKDFEKVETKPVAPKASSGASAPIPGVGTGENPPKGKS